MVLLVMEKTQLFFVFVPPSDPFCSSIKTTKTIGAKKQGRYTKTTICFCCKNTNGSLGFTSGSNGINRTNGITGSLGFDCRTPAQWNAVNLKLGPNNCYKKTDVIILTNSDKALS